MIRKFYNKIKQNITIKKGKTSYSQSGEDLIIEHLLRNLGIINPTFIDIGAFHPFFLSNTAKFYKKNKLGINIEPNPEFFKKFLKYRKDNINLNLGISDKFERRKYHIFQNQSLNTFSEIEAEKIKEIGITKNKSSHQKRAEISLDLVPIDYVFDKYLPEKTIDILSIDIEGMDLTILKSLNFDKYNVNIICVESVEYSIDGKGCKKEDLIEFLLSKNYSEYAFTGINSIFIKNKT